MSFIDPFLTCPGLPCGGTGRFDSAAELVLVGLVGDDSSGMVGGRAYIDFGRDPDLAPEERLALDGKSSIGGNDADLALSGEVELPRFLCCRCCPWKAESRSDTFVDGKGDFEGSSLIGEYARSRCSAVGDSGPTSSSLESTNSALPSGLLRVSFQVTSVAGAILDPCRWRSGAPIDSFS